MRPFSPRAVIREVGLRDGLQAESVTLTTAEKKLLYDALVAAGVTRMEVTSFVSPTAIPQLSDAEAFLGLIGPHPTVHLSALVPNPRGLERALAAGIDEATVFLSASETHNRANVKRTVDESLEGAKEVAHVAAGAKLPHSAVIATSFGCPYEGPQDPVRVTELALRLREMGFHPIFFGDTIGAASPTAVARLLDGLANRLAVRETGLHFHNTRGAALANILMGLEHGVDLFDASVGGMGGCPYAPGATGNVATEDVLAMLEGMGIETGIHLQGLVRAALVAQRLVGRELPSSSLRAFDVEKGVWTTHAH